MSEEKGRRGKGRPTKYDPSLNKMVTNLCLLGCTDEELADFLNISVATLYNHKNEHPDFLEAINEGKELADARVVKSLYKKAVGDAGAPPDTTACIFWLKNRRRLHWTDRKEVDHSVQGSVTVSIEFVDSAEDDEN